MVPNADDAPHPLDLDALIGDVRREAARRRAEPGFPLDEEARIGVESARQAPRPPRPDLDELAEAAAAMAHRTSPGHRSRPGDQAGPVGRTRELASSVLRRPFPESRGVAPLAVIVAGALRAMATVAADLDRRLRAVEGDDGTTATPDPQASPSSPDLAGPDLTSWTSRLGEHLGPTPGRVLCLAVEPDRIVSDLRQRDVDAYGVTPAGDQYRTNPDVRHGDPLDHLRSVGSDALGAACIIGTLPTGTRPGLRSLAGELARVTGTVLVVSEAPWWWARRAGPVEADLAADRPHSPETWLAVLDGSGYEGTVVYDRGGRTYLLAAERRA